MATTREIALAGAGGEPVDLFRTLNSHGFADLAPMRLDEDARTLDLTLRVPRGAPRRARIAAAGAGQAAITVIGPPPSALAEAAIVRGVRSVLRLDQDLSAFYVLATADPDLAWAAAGAGRMLRSPTVFEDVVKTICTTNCSWSLTTKMVVGLVSHLGEPAKAAERDPLANAFPTPAAMASEPESFYRETIRAGYRSPYLVRLAAMIAEGEVDLEGLALASPADLPDDELETRLLALPGVGPYAVAHILMTLGRNHRLILDSWTRPKYARLTNRRTVPTDAAIARRFRHFGEHAGLAFWLFLTRDWVD
jgi:3-methyladenine DNA glycosylase/8-oxoguanine DNA glycosylase